MPRTVSFPRPSPHVCPVCDEALTQLPCGSCGADLRRPEAAELLRIDRNLHDLVVERAAAVADLFASEPASAEPPPASPPPPRGEHVPSPWSMAEILVGLGGLSLVAAVSVFAAVAWSDLAAWAQGALLLSATAGAVGTATALRTRGLTATAESLGVVGVALGLADVEVVRVAVAGALSDRSVWALGLTAVAGGSVVVGRRTGLAGMTGLGVLLGFLPASVATSGGRLSHLALLLAVQCAIGVALESGLRRAAGGSVLDRRIARAASLGALCSGAGAALLAFGTATDTWSESDEASIAAVGAYLALAAIAVTGAVVAGWSRRTSAAALSGSALAVLGAAWASGPSPSSLPVLALTAAATGIVASTLVRLDSGRPWRAPMDTAGVVVALLSLAPLAAAVVAGLGLAEVAVAVPELAGSVDVRTVIERETTFLVGDLPQASDLTAFVALGSLGIAAAAVGRRWGRVAVLAPLVTSCIAVPVALDVSITVAVAALAAAWSLGIAWQLRRPADPWRSVTVAAVGGAFVLAAALTVPTTVVATVVVVVGTGLVAHRALRVELPSAPAWVALPPAMAVVGVALVSTRLGVGGSGPALLAIAAAAVASATGPLVARRFGQASRAAVTTADSVVGAALVVGVFATRSVDAASVATVVLGVVAGVHALRPGRKGLVGVVLAAAVVLTWLRLVAADITLLEAYTLPFAGALLVGGAVVPRGDRSSWTRNGGGLFAALAPSGTVAILDGDLLRTVVVLVAAAAVVVWGAAVREQAPLAIGGSVLALLAVRHLGPIAADLPRYVTFGVVGIGLLVTGATFERRRRELRRAVDAFAYLS